MPLQKVNLLCPRRLLWGLLKKAVMSFCLLSSRGLLRAFGEAPPDSHYREFNGKEQGAGGREVEVGSCEELMSWAVTWWWCYRKVRSRVWIKLIPPFFSLLLWPSRHKKMNSNLNRWWCEVILLTFITPVHDVAGDHNYETESFAGFLTQMRRH